MRSIALCRRRLCRRELRSVTIKTNRASHVGCPTSSCMQSAQGPPVPSVVLKYEVARVARGAPENQRKFCSR
jgi:hypothetical protein